MLQIRKTLGVLCLLAALALLATYYFNTVDPDAAVPIWKVVGVLSIVLMALTVVINMCDSLRVRRDPSAHLRQLPRDVITVIASLILMVFLHNQLLFMLPDTTENIPLWQFLDPAGVAVLAWEGIALVRSRNPAG